MPGKTKTTHDSPSRRSVTLTVDGVEVPMNGFVMEVFEETLRALVRTLHTEDERGELVLRIGADPSR